MSEDPTAKRNRGTGKGVWILGGLAALVLILVIAALLKPTPAAPDPALVAAQMQADQARIDQPRPSLTATPTAPAPAPASQAPATE